MNAETAERIRQVAAEMGYRANPLARRCPRADLAPRRHRGRRHEPVLLRHPPGRRDRGRRRRLHAARRRRGGVRRRGAASARSRHPHGRGGRAGHVADVGLVDPRRGEAAAHGRAQPLDDGCLERRARQRARHAPRGRAPPGSATRRSPTSPAPRRRGPTGSGGRRCERRRTARPQGQADGPLPADAGRRARRRRRSRAALARRRSRTTTSSRSAPSAG